MLMISCEIGDEHSARFLLDHRADPELGKHNGSSAIIKAAQKRLQVAYSIEADVPKLLQGDPHRLQQIVLNVLNNAVKFTDSGDVFMAVSAKKVVGSTQISEEMDDAKRGSAKRLRSSCADLYDILVTVKDTGIGIAAQDLKKLFQSFSQLDDTPTR